MEHGKNNDPRGREIIDARSWARYAEIGTEGEMPREIKGPSPSSRCSSQYPGMRGGGSFLSFLPRRGVASDADARNRSTMINFQSQLNYAERLSPIEEASPDGERAVCVVQKKEKKEIT